jgi:hypothetical protein
MGADAPTAGSLYEAYFTERITAQDARKTSLEQRGLAVITTSGSLATLLFALVALLSNADTFVLPQQATGPLRVALLGFGLAGLLALLTNVPLPYKNLKITDPATELRALWAKPHDEAQILLTATRVGILQRARLLNEIKAWVLVTAMVAEVVGVVAVAVAVSEVLGG